MINLQTLRSLALLLTTLIIFTHNCSAQYAGAGGQNAGIKYTCVMHPDVIADKPGQCPKCGMELVPVKPKQSEQVKSDKKPASRTSG